MDDIDESSKPNEVIYWHAKKMCLRNRIFILVAALALTFTVYLLATYKTGVIEYISPPVQSELFRQEEISYEGKFGPVDITLVAEYSIEGIVKSKNNYRIDTSSMVSPMDLVLAWGDLNSKENTRDISFSQAGRWYYYNVKSGAEITLDDVLTQSSNTHIIPENDEILTQLRKMKKNDLVELKGYLVNVELFEGQELWSSSMTREDSGDRSCEIMYVTEVTIK